MAWVNRTTRDQCPGGLQAKAATAGHLGPGCYETSPSRRVRPNAAGFGSGEKFVRGANAGTIKGATMVTPGPGAYSSANQTPWESPTKSKASSTASFQSKSQRLGELKLRKGFSTPGPGAYTKPDPFDLKQKTNLRNSLLKTPPSNNKIRWTRLPTAPSIPTVSQSFGYEQGPYGKLVRHEPAKVGHTGRGDDTLGPGEYEPMKGLKSVNKSRTTDFSKGKVARFIEQEIRSKADVPGPGEYSASGNVSVSKDAARISAVFKSSITREQGAQPNAAKNVPGPGAYHSNQAHSFAAEPKPEHLQFFGSTVTRFKSAQRSAQQSVNNFGSTTKRFDTISSGAQRVPETLESQLERDMKEQGGANHHTESVSKIRQQKKASSMFASSTGRPNPSERATGPSPGDYERETSPEVVSVTVTDQDVTAASEEASAVSNDGLQEAGALAKLDISSSSHTGGSSAESAANALPPRPVRVRKASVMTASTSKDRKRRKNGATRSNSRSNTPSIEAAASSIELPPRRGNSSPAVPTETAKPLLSDSQWEREIAGFGSVLDDMMARVTNRELVEKTAAYMKTFPQHALRFQIKMKQVTTRAVGDATRGFQAKLMLFYVLHEFLKSFEGERRLQVQREWFQAVDEVLHACVRDMRSSDTRSAEDNRKRIFKIKAWKSLVLGECKPRRAPMRLPRSDTERLAEAPDQLQQFQPPPPSVPQLRLNRSNCPLVFERCDFSSKFEEKQHWRYTAVAFIDTLSRCLGLSSDIALTACMFFHRVFDRGIYAQERYKFAAACLFLSAKAASKRMKLLRMVRTMYDILETPLLAGDEELLEIERMQLLYYEIEVLQGINFELTTEMPFYYLRRVLEQMPEQYRNDLQDDAQTILEELYVAYQGQSLACSELLPDGEGDCRHFDALVKTSSSLGGDDAFDIKEVFKPQLGGLRVDPSIIRNDAEFTKQEQNESKDWLRSIRGNDSSRSTEYSSSRRDDRAAPASSTSGRRRDTDDDRPIKVEYRSQGSSRDDERRRGRDRDRDRYRTRSRSRSRSGSDSRRVTSSVIKYERSSGSSSRTRSGDRDRDRYDNDYDDYDTDRDRYRDRGRRDDYRSSYHDRDDRRDSRDVEYRRDPSYFDRREREASRGGSDHRGRQSRSGSRSASRSRSPRESSRSSGKKRKRTYSSRDRSASRSRSSSRSYSRDRGASGDGPSARASDRQASASSSTSRKATASRTNDRRRSNGSASRRDAERPRIKQESSAA
ncbi:hypothetical protein BBJ28_00008740 [Nothophytophthora sp. Chile5]|nr:hypothetical protein BBJ28_00008740 [Nothophytophthora sp. Chile5]